MSITATATATSADPTTSTATAKNTLGKNEFLRLLTAQLSNQDPLNPVDNQAFIAQLAQFSSLEQMQNVSSQLDTLLLSSASQTQLGATNLVGKRVSFNATSVGVAADGTLPSVQVQLPSAATVTATIQDANGQTIRTLSYGAQAAGTFDLGWDGRDASGTKVAAGSYGVTLSAAAADGTSVSATTRVTGVVSGVTFDSGAASLVVAGDTVKMSDVVQVSQP